MILTDEICEFLTGGVSILLASRNATLVPSIARAKGCRAVGGERASLRIIVSAAHAGELLEDVRRSGVVSATFTRPDTHRTLQFKGGDARVDAIQPEDRAAVEAYVPTFAATIDPLGFANEFTRAFFMSPGDEVAIEFTPAQAFQQTPGPAAGARIA